MSFAYRSFSLLATCYAATLAYVAPAQSTRVNAVRFLDVYTVPNETLYEGTPVGGLSGIDYDPMADVYYIICDDRSALKPARYYKASIKLNGEKIDTVIFTEKTDLFGPDGKPYQPIKADPKHTVDPEGLRYNPITKQVVWVSEGERILSAKDTVLVDPEIILTRNGKYVDRFPIPENVRMMSREYGARQNGTLEAVTFADDYNTLWVALEEPLFQDGPRADVDESKALVRFYRYDMATHKNTAQYAYDLEPVAHSPILSSAFRVNGITDILDAGANQFLVLERSFSTGRLPCTVKLFLADLSSGTNVKDIASMKDNTTLKPVTKKLLLDMDTLTIHVDNVEGMTWGPKLPNGKRSLVLVSDNNFQGFQKTQVFLLEVDP